MSRIPLGGSVAGETIFRIIDRHHGSEQPARWSKRSVVEGHIEVKGPEREKGERGFLSSDLARQR